MPSTFAHFPQFVMTQQLRVGPSVCPACSIGPGTGWTLGEHLLNL